MLKWSIDNIQWVIDGFPPNNVVNGIHKARGTLTHSRKFTGLNQKAFIEGWDLLEQMHSQLYHANLKNFR